MPQACKSERNLGDVAHFDRLLTTGLRFSWENSPKLSRRFSCVAHAWWTLDSQRKDDVHFLEARHLHIQSISHAILNMKFLIVMTLWPSVCMPIKNCTATFHVLVWNVGVTEDALFIMEGFERNIAGVRHTERETMVAMHKVTCKLLPCIIFKQQKTTLSCESLETLIVPCRIGGQVSWKNFTRRQGDLSLFKIQ